MKKLTTCCFTGHRAEKLPWKQNERDPRCLALKAGIADVLSSLYAAGCRHFICGMATGCDMYFGEAVVALRSEHPDVFLEAAIPYEGQSERWDDALRRRYFRLAEECDKQSILHRGYTPDCSSNENLTSSEEDFSSGQRSCTRGAASRATARAAREALTLPATATE